jgi:hypothetical protein
LLPINTYLDLEKEREQELEAEGDCSENSTNLLNFFSNHSTAKDKDMYTESLHIHNKAIFDAFNDALSS